MGAAGSGESSTVKLVDVSSGEVVQEVAVQDLGLTTDSGSTVGLSLLALSRAGSAADYRWVWLRQHIILLRSSHMN